MATRTKKTKTYTARCEREGRWWIVTVPELPGVVTQARNLESARALAVDAIALWLDTSTDRIAVELEVEGTSDAVNEWREAAVARAEALRLGREAAARARAAIEALDGLTVRDAAAVLGDVSYQRVQQLRGAKEDAQLQTGKDQNVRTGVKSRTRRNAKV